jgi:hypothetical protein
MLDEAYMDYKSKNIFLYTDKLYEYGFYFIRDIVGMAKLKEIADNTSGTKETVRKAQIIYLFENEFKKNETKTKSIIQV